MKVKPSGDYQHKSNPYRQFKLSDDTTSALCLCGNAMVLKTLLFFGELSILCDNDVPYSYKSERLSRYNALTCIPTDVSRNQYTKHVF
jgi:hypothetical protein